MYPITDEGCDQFAEGEGASDLKRDQSWVVKLRDRLHFSFFSQTWLNKSIFCFSGKRRKAAEGWLPYKTSANYPDFIDTLPRGVVLLQLLCPSLPPSL